MAKVNSDDLYSDCLVLYGDRLGEELFKVYLQMHIVNSLMDAAGDEMKAFLDPQMERLHVQARAITGPPREGIT